MFLAPLYKYTIYNFYFDAIDAFISYNTVAVIIHVKLPNWLMCFPRDYIAKNTSVHYSRNMVLPKVNVLGISLVD